MRLVALTLGFLVVASLPCWVALAVAADDVFERAARTGRRALRRWRRLAGQPLRDRWRMARLERDVRGVAAALPDRPAVPPIEQVAADLRRLAEQRAGVARRSPVWFTAVQRAYDDRLRTACQSLRVEQHLGELTGVDLEIERVRVAGALEQAGMDLRTRPAGRPQDLR